MIAAQSNIALVVAVEIAVAALVTVVLDLVTVLVGKVAVTL